MKRIVAWGWHRLGEIMALESLSRQKKVEIVAWVGNARECTHNLDELLHQFRIETCSCSGAANQIYDQVYSSLAEFIEHYSRVSFSMGRTFQELLHIFNIYVDYFAWLLTAKRVDVVFFSNLPHFGVDYLLYVVAKALGVQTTMCNQSLVANRFFYVREVEDFGYFRHATENRALPYLTVEKRFEKPIFYLGAFKRPRIFCTGSLLSDLFHMALGRKSKPMTLAGAFQKFQNSLEYKRCHRKQEKEDVDFTANYVYFPLQMQPELTTSILGGMYADQLLALEQLARMLPEGWRIYAKENPKQGRRQREALFYQRLSRIAAVDYVAPSVNTYDLIRGSRFVATVTGTVGWEAITGGKPCVVFGKAWYRTFPGVFEFNRLNGIDEVLACVIDHEALERQYNSIMRRTAEGVLDSDYNVLIDGFSDKANALLVENFLLSELYGTRPEIP